MEKKSKFNALTSEVLKENKPIYTEALDFAFNDSHIKNIAITGIYGAGKSTVWNTYVNEKKLDNIITVSLGKYIDNDIKQNETVGKSIINTEPNLTNNKSDCDIENGYHIDNDNRIERQLINQILSQIKLNKIPLSKYNFKLNKKRSTILFQSLASVSIISSILLWITKDSIKPVIKPVIKHIIKEPNNHLDDLSLMLLCVILLYIPLLYFFIIFYRRNKLRIHKISFKGAEANINDLDKNDESILDRDIKELVYLLKSSDSKVIVFEDLDRYDNISIYTKLRELNFILNKHIITNTKRKFNFENCIYDKIEIIIEKMKKPKNNLKNEPVRFIYMLKDSLFFSKNRTKFFDFILPIVPVVDSKTSENELIELLKEVDNAPDIRVLTNISLYIDDMRLLKNIVNEYIVYSKIIPLDKLELDRNKLFALITLKNIFPNEFDLLQEDKGYIKNVFNTLEIKRKTLLHDKTNNVREDIMDCSYSDIIIIKMSSDERDELFSDSDFNITRSHYFPLIRFLIVNGLLDETYWYYKGNFDVERSNTLKQNDIIYMKGLMEGKDMDIFLDVETPNEIIKRLKLSDFSRYNILNKKILQTCIEQKKTNFLISITESVDKKKKYSDLIKIMNELGLQTTREYFDILLEDIDLFENVLDSFESSNTSLSDIALISLLESSDKRPDKMYVFTINIIENKAHIISCIANDKFENFIKNICSYSIKFKNLFESGCDRERLLQIEKEQAYKLSVENLLYISKVLLGKVINYGSLLGEIYQSEILSKSKKYIEENFESFICEYIDELKKGETYNNDEGILIKLLKSNISEEYKLKYIENNITKISKLNVLKDTDITKKILDNLLKENIIKCSSENMNVYWNMIEEYDEEFLEYLDKNINEYNYEDILSNNISICNELINDFQVSDKVYDYAILYADIPIDNVSSELKQSRVDSIVDKGLLRITDENIEMLIENLYNEELIKLVNIEDQDIEDDVISIIIKNNISDELIYSLVNSNISDANSLKLIEIISDSVSIEKIKSTKEYIIEYIISRKLTDENIKYICSTFKTFRLKDMFIEELDYRGELDRIDDENLNEVFINFVLKSKIVNIDTKIALIIRKIENKINAKLLKEYISYVQEISELSNVWNKKRPVLDNFYKEKIGESLIEFGYVKSGRYKGKKNIRLQKVNI
jgi:hypothetical protein